MLRLVSAGTIAAALGALSLIGAAPALAAYPGSNGKLAFTSPQDGGGRHIFVTTGGGIKDLTGVNSAAEETQPEFSPDGSKIVFTRFTSSLGNTQIFVMSANGTNRKALTHTATGNSDPTWSPDGKHIAFVSERAGIPGEIYIMNSDGTQVRRLTHNSAAETDLVWSPTGGRIAFVHEVKGGGDRDIYSIKTDGTGLKNLTQDPNNDEIEPDYSPNGMKIVYNGDFHPTGSVGSDLWVMYANGTNVHPLNHESNGYSDGSYPAWSPNGNMIAFSANNGTGDPGVWKVPAVGGNNFEAVANDQADWDIDWQPLP